MSNIRINLLVLIGLISMYGCAASFNTNFPLIETGMSRAEVDSFIGRPISAESGPEGTKITYYKLASSFLDTDGSDTREYFVAFQGDEVIGYGERHDEITMQRQIVQFNAAWNPAKTVTRTRVEVDVYQR